MTDFDALLNAAFTRRTQDPHSAEVTLTVSGSPVLVKFTELDAKVWAACRLADIPRPGVVVDTLFRFNVTAAAMLAAPISGVRVDGDGEHEITPAQWQRLFDAIEAIDLQQITDAVIAVNEDAQMQRLESAKKVLEGASKRKRPSHAN